MVLYDVVNFNAIQGSHDQRLLLDAWIEEAIALTEEKEMFTEKQNADTGSTFVEMEHV